MLRELDGRLAVQAVSVTPKHEVLIPEAMLAPLNVKPGDRVFVVNIRGHLELIPEVDLSTLRGRFQGIDSTVERRDEWV